MGREGQYMDSIRDALVARRVMDGSGRKHGSLTKQIVGELAATFRN